MHKARIKKWIDALRSGQYRRGRDHLHYRDDDGDCKFCALGVLCDIYSKDTGHDWDTGDKIHTIRGESEFLPSDVFRWLGLTPHEHDKDILIGGIAITALNDRDGASFRDIANRLESTL